MRAAPAQRGLLQGKIGTKKDRGAKKAMANACGASLFFLFSSRRLRLEGAAIAGRMEEAGQGDSFIRQRPRSKSRGAPPPPLTFAFLLSHLWNANLPI